MDRETLKYWLALRAVEDVGCVGFRTLLQAFSSPREVFSASGLTLRAIPGIGAKIADNIRSFSSWGKIEGELDLAEKTGVEIITAADSRYPRNLSNIYDYPPYLYVKGSLLPDDVCVAIVGSRVASVYGRYTTERLSRELALQGITIVSGLARGIDAAAHRGACPAAAGLSPFSAPASIRSIRRKTKSWRRRSRKKARLSLNLRWERRRTRPISRPGIGLSAGFRTGLSSSRPARKAGR